MKKIELICLLVSAYTKRQVNPIKSKAYPVFGSWIMEYAMA
jgi:hypothetical protein